jgi:hypothetical protein
MSRNYERDEREGYSRNQRQNREQEGQNRWSSGREDDYGWGGQGQEGRNWRGDEPYRRNWPPEMGEGSRGEGRSYGRERGMSGWQGRSDWNQGTGGGWNQGSWNQGMSGREYWRDRANMQGQGPHSGRGPRSYKRQDDRIEEDINEQLTRHPMIDASDIEVQVQNGEVALRGSVDSRDAKRMAEDVAESVFGVKDINNQIKIKQHGDESETASIPRDRKAS